jgi:hypothetical protein
MKVLNSIGSKERFVEIFQRVNKGIKLNEALLQGLNPNCVLEDSFNQLKTGRLKIEHSHTQSSDNKTYVELICLDKQNNNITFTFRVVAKEGDQEGVFNIESVTLTQFGFDDADGENTINMDESALKQFNAAHASEIASIVSEYVDIEEPVDIDMDEQYRTAIERIDAIPYAKGTETMVKHSEYADQKPTNPDLRAGDEFNKFVKEEMDDTFNPEDIERDFNMYYNPEIDDDEPLVDPDTIQPSEEEEEVPEEKKRIILQAYDNLVERAKKQRKYNYSPTLPEIEDEILRITGKKVVKEKTRVFPKEAEPWLEENTSVDTIVQKTLTLEEKKKYIEKAKDFLETQIGAEAFYGMMPEERNKQIAYYANEIFFLEMAHGNYGVSMNEEESSEYSNPDEGDEEEIERIAREKEAVGDMLPGGKADGKSPLDYPVDQIKMGLEVEKEHTDNPLIAIEIATDHLEEFPDYYTRLDAMEKEAKAENGEGEEENEYPSDVMDSEVEDKEKTDKLLGYKPINVGETIQGGYDFAAAERNYFDNEAYKKYLEMSQRDFNSMSDDEKEEFFQLWTQFKGAEKMNETPSNIENTQAHSDKLNTQTDNITEQKIKLAKQVLGKRGHLSEGMTKKEAVQILIKHNIK